jgi:hypothetical protein
MILYDRLTDGKAHSHPLGLRREQWLEDTAVPTFDVGERLTY